MRGFVDLAAEFARQAALTSRGRPDRAVTIDRETFTRRTPLPEVTASDLGRLFARYDADGRPGLSRVEHRAALVAGLRLANERAVARTDARRNDAVARALTGRTVRFADRRGVEVALTVTAVPTRVADGSSTWKVSLDGQAFELVVPHGASIARAVAQVGLAVIEGVPPAARALVQRIELRTGANPADAYWAERYRMPGFGSRASAGGGTIVIYHYRGTVEATLMGHEVGHLLGARARKEALDELGWLARRWRAFTTRHDTSVPLGWPAIIAAEPRAVSEYARASADEDFAESFQAYLAARQVGGVVLARFRAGFPRRVAKLEALLGLDPAA